MEDSAESRLAQIRMLERRQLCDVLEAFSCEREVFAYSGHSGAVSRVGEHHLYRLIAAAVDGDTASVHAAEIDLAGRGPLRANLALIGLLELAASSAGPLDGRSAAGPGEHAAIELVETMRNVTDTTHADTMMTKLESHHTQAHLTAISVAVMHLIVATAQDGKITGDDILRRTQQR